mmetsp:Transcript_127452/g.225871  ORF Transcript_127452/g.225871 Transcript_127452/m.225871 type:complete len:200 (+) Transcript_127452:224-823(+)
MEPYMLDEKIELIPMRGSLWPRTDSLEKLYNRLTHVIGPLGAILAALTCSPEVQTYENSSGMRPVGVFVLQPLRPRPQCHNVRIHGFEEMHKSLHLLLPPRKPRRKHSLARRREVEFQVVLVTLEKTRNSVDFSPMSSSKLNLLHPLESTPELLVQELCGGLRYVRRSRKSSTHRQLNPHARESVLLLPSQAATLRGVV